jgi:hypothetical protein
MSVLTKFFEDEDSSSLSEAFANVFQTNEELHA